MIQNCVVVIACSLVLLSAACVAAQTQNVPPPPEGFTVGSNNEVNPWTAIILVCLMMTFFLMGCISVCIRQCAERNEALYEVNFGSRMRGAPPLGLDPDVVDGFPTFFYSHVKRHKIGKGALECAVCLNEFFDEGETLRLLPTCNHVFHTKCIDTWLTSHVTCPVCRANLVPQPGEPKPIFVLTQDSVHLDNVSNEIMIEINQPEILNRTQASENFERFTLRLSDEVRRELVKSSLSRTRSCVTFPRVRSTREGYRSSSTGNNNHYYERFDRMGQLDRWGITMKSPFDRLFGRKNKHNVGERSFDRLNPGGNS